MIKPDDYDVVLQGRSNIYYKAEKLRSNLPDPCDNKDLVAALSAVKGLVPQPHKATGKLFIKQPVEPNTSIAGKNRFNLMNSIFSICDYRLHQIN